MTPSQGRREGGRRSASFKLNALVASSGGGRDSFKGVRNIPAATEDPLSPRSWGGGGLDWGQEGGSTLSRVCTRILRVLLAVKGGF